MLLKDKVSLITGAAKGIGKAIALRLAAEGSLAIVNDINIDNIAKTAQELKKMNLNVAAIPGDIGNTENVAKIFSEIKEKFGRLDILVNNAGIIKDSMLHKMDIKDWEEVLRINLSGSFYCLQKAAIIMREQNYGRIINISSISWQGNIGQINYSASKAGIVGMTKTAARELGKKNITVNAVCPGFIDTEMTRSVPSKIWELMISKIYMGRVGKPEDVANLVTFLASDEASYITGEIINVNGGMVL